MLVSAVVDTAGDCSSYGQEYVEAVQGTGDVVLDMCSSSWGANAQQLGAASASVLSALLLSALPDESTLEVQFDGTVSPTGWHYDALRNAIVIDFDLPDGTEVTVSYDSLGCE